ncbi:MAG: sugar phosphate nucleotidyltransferase [Bacteroidota bacterium]
MRAVVPVAGIGSRLRPHTYTLPKVLINVAGKPIIGHIMDSLIEAGFADVTVIVGYMGDMIQEYVSGHYEKIAVTYVEQEERLGLGHAVYSARHTFGREPILIILGDTIFEVNLRTLTRSKYTTLGVRKVEDPRRFGVVETKKGFAAKLVEKPGRPKSNLALVGLYYIVNTPLLLECLEFKVERGLRTHGEYQLTDALQLMIDRGEKMKVFEIDGWYDCGKPDTLLDTNRHLLKRTATKHRVDGVVIVPPVFISRKAKVSGSVIGPYATIAEGAVVEDSVIRNSIVSEGAHVQKALLDSSIIGNNATVFGSFKRINVGDSSEIDFY